ncbi:MAG: M6 family metalloprotease domain-containing protein [Candidatus Cloacimonetes bacterium]|nr:M6 family metalloprotease domain-containing protein [Candidatus Cloacimonadota bacterium]
MKIGKPNFNNHNLRNIIMIFFVIVISFGSTNLHAVWVNNRAVQLTQPDGTVLDLLITGDEFHRRVHNADGYTIIQDRNTGYWTWAMLENDNLVPSSYPVHRFSPRDLGIEPGINISNERYRERRARMDDSQARYNPTLATGTINNLVILIEFPDVGTEIKMEQNIADYEEDFNDNSAGANSLKSYFNSASYEKLTVESHFFPDQSGATVAAAITADQDRAYYTLNGSGGAGGDIAEQELRLHTLFKAVIEDPAINAAIIAKFPNLDDIGVGSNVDSVVFIMAGVPEIDLGSMLWPHEYVLFQNNPAQRPTIGTKTVFGYNLNFEGHGTNWGRTVGVYAHEFAHTLGAPDMYTNENDDIDAVGEWCLMAHTHDDGQSMSAYVKSRLGWLDLTPITATDTGITINHLTSSTNSNVAYKIDSVGSSPAQYFVMEYRNKDFTTPRTIDTGRIPGSGLLVYRVVESADGNLDDQPYELYVYRPGGLIDDDGDIEDAHFSLGVSRTEINDTTDPASFIYTNAAGTTSGHGGLDISNIGAATDNTITFDVTIQSPNPPPTALTATEDGSNNVSLSWTAPASANLEGFRVFSGETNTGPWTRIHQTSSPTTTTFQVIGLVDGTYHFHVTARYAGDTESAPSNVATISLSNGIIANPPQNLTGTPAPSQVNLTWDAPDASTLTLGYYRIYRSTSAAGPWTPIHQTPNSTYRSYQDNPLLNGTYHYHVIAIYTGIIISESLPSSSISVTVTVQSSSNEGGITILALKDPAAGNSTVATVMPVLSWTHTDNWDGAPEDALILPSGPESFYEVRLSKDANFTNPIIVRVGHGDSSVPPKTIQIPLDKALDYDSTYFWRVHQFNGYKETIDGVPHYHELMDPSNISSFATPKMSVYPILELVAPGTTGNYFIQFSDTNNFTNTSPTVVDTGSATPFYQYPDVLSYNTTYYYRVRRGPTGAWQPVQTITTKPLTVLQEKYERNSITLNLNDSIKVNDIITYTAITDEIEDLSTNNINADFFVRSSISDAWRDSVHENLKFQAPDSDGRVSLVANFNVIARKEETAAVNEIKITNHETITFNFQYGNEFFLSSDMERKNIDEFEVYTVSFGNNPAGSDISATQLNLFLQFTTDDTPAIGSSQKIFIQNMDNPDDILVRYAYVLAEAPNVYRYTLTRNDIWNFYDLTDPNKINQNRPIRISIYPADPQGEDADGKPIYIPARDYMWYNHPLPSTITIAGTAQFNNPNGNPPDNLEHKWNEEILVMGLSTLWTRIVSDTDQVGFLLQGTGATPPSITIANYTDPTTNTIYAKVGDKVRAVQINSTGNELASTTIIAQGLSIPFSIVQPGNMTLDSPIFLRFEWSDALASLRNYDDTPHYLFEIANNTDFTPNNPDDSDDTNWLWSHQTREYFVYLPQDLVLGEHYYWRVRAFDGSDYHDPNQYIGGISYYALTTMNLSSGSTLIISGTIAGNREFNPENDVEYLFQNNATIGPNATLTIPPGTEVKIAPGESLTILGNIVVNGYPENVTFKSSNDDIPWGGLIFAGDGANREPLVVDADYKYVSGGTYINGLVLSNALNPITYLDGANFDVYIENSKFIDNANGIQISEGSYIRNTEFEDFKINGTSNDSRNNSRNDLFGIQGGYYFFDVTIDGEKATDKFAGDGIITTRADAIVLESTIKNILGNGIFIDAETGTALIQHNTIQGTGTDANNIAIKAVQGATLTNNKIGNVGGMPGEAGEKLRNTGFAIINGSLIDKNIIAQNGNGAILADVDAVVTNNKISDNQGYGIVNGVSIQNNIIENSATAIIGFRVGNAILADPNANVSNNTITNHTGYGIRNGAFITDNTIIIAPSSVTPDPANPVENQSAIWATAGVDALIENNIITNPVGFGIRNGTAIISNEITGLLSHTAIGSFGIDAELNATVQNNIIKDMQSFSIQNGAFIHQNTITNGFDGIIAQPESIVIENTLTKTITNIQPGFAIRGGLQINLNTVEGFYLSGTALNHIISSQLMTEFIENKIEENQSIDGSIFYVFRPQGDTTPLTISGNTFTNNVYSDNTLRVSSFDLTITDNIIENDVSFINDDEIEGGGLHPSYTNAPDTFGTAIYLYLHPSNTLMERNEVVGHRGNIYGAALYIDSPNATNKIVIQEKNTFSNNHAYGEGGRGSAIYHRAGTVYLGPENGDNPNNKNIFGNTITYNSVVKIEGPNDANEWEDSELFFGSAIHTINSLGQNPAGQMWIYRNIISANSGNWAIWGAPMAIEYNNIYNNTLNGKDELYSHMIIESRNPQYNNQSRHFRYIHNQQFNFVKYNFWGSRSDMGQINPSIYHQDNDATLGRVTYQPIESGPYEWTPGIVDHITELYVKGVNENAPRPTDPQDPDYDEKLEKFEEYIKISSNLTFLITGEILYVVVAAEDNNKYSRDFTQVTIMNETSGQYILPLLLEVKNGEDLHGKEFYYVAFMLTKDGEYNINKNLLPAEDGDRIRIEASNGRTEYYYARNDKKITVYPNVGTYLFGELQDNDSLEKRFIFTNELKYDVKLLGDPYAPKPTLLAPVNPAIEITGADAAMFEIVNWEYIPHQGSIIPDGASFEVVVRYKPTSGGIASHTARLDINFQDMSRTTDTDRYIILKGTETDLYKPPPEYNPHLYFGPMFGTQMNQTVIEARIYILDEQGYRTPPVNSWVGVFRNPTAGGEDKVEELRGLERINNTNGQATIEIHTHEEIDVYFKILEPHPTSGQPMIWETPLWNNMRIRPQITHHNVPVIGTAPVDVSGIVWDIDDNEDPSEATDLEDVPGIPGVIVRNLHEWRDRYQSPGDHLPIELDYKYVTDARGRYFFRSWINQRLILIPENDGYDFEASVIQTHENGSDPEVLRNTKSIDYPYFGTISTIQSVYLNALMNYKGNFESIFPYDETPHSDLMHPVSFQMGDVIRFLPNQPINSPDPNLVFFKTTGSDYDYNNHFRGTRKMYPIAGRINVATGFPFANAPFTLAGEAMMTDEYGYFYTLKQHGYEIKDLIIVIENDDLAISTYGDIQFRPDDATYPDGVNLKPTTTHPNGKVESMFIAQEINLYKENEIQRTQNILLEDGWNVISFNVDFTEYFGGNHVSKVFGIDNQYLASDIDTKATTNRIEEVRTTTQGWTHDAAVISGQLPVVYVRPASENDPTSHGAYNVFVNTNEPIVLRVTGNPIFAHELSLVGVKPETSGWNLVGYVPGKPGQTRAVVRNNPGIGLITNPTETYFYNDNPIGASTMRYMRPGLGYWMAADWTAPRNTEHKYDNRHYNNVLDRFMIVPSDGPNSNQPYRKTHLIGVIDDEYLGFPIAVNDLNGVIEEGKTYKIHSNNNDIAIPDLKAHGAITGLVGEIFTAIKDSGSPISDVEVRNILGPKLIEIDIPLLGDADGQLALPIFINDKVKSDMVFQKVYTEAEYKAAYETFDDPTGDTGWFYFLDKLLKTGTTLSTFTNWVRDNNYYIVLSNQTLEQATDDPYDIHPNQENAHIVVYEVRFTDVDGKDEHDSNLHTVGLKIGDKYYWGVHNGNVDNEFIIAIPDNEFPVVDALFYFHIDGSRMYVEDKPNYPNLGVDDLKVSGEYKINLPNDTSYKWKQDLWVAQAQYPFGAIERPEKYNVHFIKLPSTDFSFEHEEPTRSMPSIPTIEAPIASRSSSSSETIDERGKNPYGNVFVYPNSHLFLTRITDAGFAINPENTMVAFVGDELRAKARVVNYNGNSYSILVVNSIEMDEEITFGIYLNNVFKVFEETAFTIPGGTTGSMANPFVLRYDRTLSEDNPVEIPFINELQSNYPNPFNPSTNIRFSLKEDQHASIVIYNVRGQRVVTLVDEILEKGHHHLIWEGVDTYGRQVGSGVYFIRMQTDGYTKVNRAVMLK